jgi:hypothetical protein
VKLNFNFVLPYSLERPLRLPPVPTVVRIEVDSEQRFTGRASNPLLHLIRTSKDGHVSSWFARKETSFPSYLVLGINWITS